MTTLIDDNRVRVVATSHAQYFYFCMALACTAVAFLGFGLVLVMRSHFNVQADFRPNTRQPPLLASPISPNRVIPLNLQSTPEHTP